ncbi:MAG: head maturation protease, ClpP-related [Lachnospiraceae bacterium]
MMHETQMKWTMNPVQEENKALLYIYDDVSEYGEWNWETWNYDESETSAKHFAEKLGEIPQGQPIEIHINSNGGSVKEGVAIYNLIKQKANHKIGIVDGVAHSVAFLILQACDERKMCLGTTALVHNMWMRCAGNSTQLRKYADDLDDMMEANRQVFLERATITEDELKQIMEAETYLTPSKALEYGLIDEIYSGKKANDPNPEDLMQKLQEMRQMMNRQQSFREQIAQMKKPVKQQGPEPDGGLLNIFKGITARKGE